MKSKRELDEVQENSLTSNPGGRSPDREFGDKHGRPHQRSSQSDDVKQEQAIKNPQGIINSGAPTKSSTSKISDKQPRSSH